MVMAAAATAAAAAARDGQPAFKYWEEEIAQDGGRRRWGPAREDRGANAGIVEQTRA